MDWLYYSLLLVVLVAGFAINLMTLPGLWLMFAGLVGYALLTGWGVHVGWAGVIVVLLLALVAEILESLLGGAAAKKAGGSTRAAIGAITGAIAGALFLSIPLFIVGTVIGACLGAFLGALVAELTVRGDTLHSTRVGYAAAVGRFIGILTKMAFGIVIFAVAAVIARPDIWPSASTPPATLPATTTTAPTPTTAPATSPAEAPPSLLESPPERILPVE